MKERLLGIGERKGRMHLGKTLPKKEPQRHDLFPPDALGYYLEEIGTYALLTRDEEQALGKLRQDAELQIDTINTQIHPSDLSIAALEKAKEQYEYAVQTLVVRNLRLVVPIARWHQQPGMDLLDLISHGNRGLMEAAKKFDPGRETAFSTFAMWSIRQSIMLGSYNEATTIRIPVWVWAKLRNYSTKVDELSERLGREPSVEELSLEFDIAKERIQEFLRATRRMKSIELAIGDTNNTEDIQDQGQTDELERIEDLLIYTTLIEYIQKLQPNRQFILQQRFYFGRTYDEISKMLGLTRGWVQQIERKALQRLSKMQDVKELYEAITGRIKD